jgi:hypothetical protein
MYDDIHVTVEKELDYWVYQDIEVNFVLEDDPHRFDRATKHVLTHPEQVLFVDEVGANTSQKQDRNIGGRKLVVAHGTWPHERNSYTDCHFTVLGFTAANGTRVVCAVVVTAKHLTAFEATGINYLSKYYLQFGRKDSKIWVQKRVWSLVLHGANMWVHGRRHTLFCILQRKRIHHKSPIGWDAETNGRFWLVSSRRSSNDSRSLSSPRWSCQPIRPSLLVIHQPWWPQVDNMHWQYLWEKRVASWRLPRTKGEFQHGNRKG